jgi:hypothetical protein
VLIWLHKSTGFIPLLFMSDCALAITKAIALVFQDHTQAPKHYWCLFHVLKAFKKKAQTHLPDKWEAAFSQFRVIVYLPNNPRVPLFNYMLHWGQVSPRFQNYVEQQWAPRMHNLAIYYRMVSHFDHPDRSTFADYKHSSFI